MTVAYNWHELLPWPSKNRRGTFSRRRLCERL
jgi:hypothetical protein